MRAKEFIIENRINNTNAVDRLFSWHSVQITNHKYRNWFNTKIKKMVMNDPENQQKITDLSLTPLYSIENPWDKKDAEAGTLVDFFPKHQLVNQLAHIRDWLIDMPEGHPFEKALNGIQSVDIAYQWADKYFAKKNNSVMITNDGVEIISKDNDMVWVEVQTPGALNTEGKLMQHCVGSYAEKVSNGTKIISLRDKRNQPHCTLEVRGDYILQIKGKQNTAPVEKYVPYVKRFVLKHKLNVMGDQRNIGLISYNGKNFDVNELPEHVYIIGALELENFKLLTKLPRYLKVGGLYLKDCINLKELPDNLFVGSNLNANGCSSLEKIGNNITVNQEVRLSNCVSLKEIPFDFVVGSMLYVNGCTSLKSIILKQYPPKVYAVGCTSLVELPTDRVEAGKLIFNGCTSLAKLPNRLSCSELGLNGCIGITELPVNLECEVLDLRGCINLKEIPETLQMDWRDSNSKIIIDADSEIIIPNNKFRIQRALTSLK